MKNPLAIPALLVLLLAAANAGGPAAALKKSPQAASPAALAALAPQGEKNPLPAGGWFTWKFAEKPRLGTVIVRVQVFNRDGRQEKTAEVTGESGMPSMRYHDSGPARFKLNRKGDYLLPVDVVMPGEWQLVIRVKQAKKEVYAGKVIFNI